MAIVGTAAPARDGTVWEQAVRLWQTHGEQQWLPVSGHSMLPLLRAGDWIQVRSQTAYTVGDLLVFVQDDQLVVHRLIGRAQRGDDTRGWRTQGDNCTAPDPALATSQIVGKVVAIRRGQACQQLAGPLWRFVNRLLGACTAATRFLPLRRLRHLLLRLAARHLHHVLAVPTPPTNQVAYLLTRQQLTPITSAMLRDLAHGAIDWDGLHQVVTSHGVAPLVWHNLQAIGVDDLAVPIALRSEFQAQTYRNIAVKAGVQAKLAALCALCDAQAVDVLLLKGAALDQLVYAQPWYVVHDIDLLLRFRPHVSAADKVARQVIIDRYFWTLPGFEYEFDTHHDLTMNGLLAIDIDALWARARVIAVADQPLWVMGAADLLMAACINACRKRFFHLKSLLAISAIIERNPDLDWAQVVAQAGRYQITAMVYVALLVTHLTLDMTLPSQIARQLRLSPLRVMAIQIAVRLLRKTGLPRLSSAADKPIPPNRFLILAYLAYSPHQLWGKARALLCAALRNKVHWR